jgi:hypothetical protein
MLATFCLRLACGLVGSLLLLSPAQVNPRFYRVQLLTALGLTAVAAVFLWKDVETSLWLVLVGGVVFAGLGSLLWSLDGAPAGRLLVVLTAACLVASLGLLKSSETFTQSRAMVLAGEASSAALLGAATTAMLMGHSYLIAPSMSLTPLMRLLGAIFAAVFVRALVAGTGLWFWTAEHSLANLNDVTMLLPLRWGLGLVGPLVLAAMAWQTAKIRSTQSATGILYVVVIFTFLGELIGQLLCQMTGGFLL